MDASGCGGAGNRPTPPGQANIQSVVPTKVKQTIGVQYFQHMTITWSIRSRGSVHRTQVITNTPATPLASRFSRPAGRPLRH